LFHDEFNGGIHFFFYHKKFHTLGIAAICWAIWKSHNKAGFEGKSVQEPASIVCYACVRMSSWAGLYLDDDKEAMLDGVNTMMKIAMKLVNKKQKHGGQKLLEDNNGNYDASLTKWRLLPVLVAIC
jgi:hypothetical protein